MSEDSDGRFEDEEELEDDFHNEDAVHDEDAVQDEEASEEDSVVDLYVDHFRRFYEPDEAEEGLEAGSVDWTPEQKKEALTRMVHDLYMMHGVEAMNFVVNFEDKCGNDPALLGKLFGLAYKVAEKGGGNGCAVVSVSRFRSLDMDKLERAVDAYCQKDYKDCGEGLAEFFYLLNLTDAVGIFDRELYGVFADLMRDAGTLACEELARIIKYYDADDPCPDLGRNCAALIKAGLDAGRVEPAHEYMKVPGIRRASARVKDVIYGEALAYLESGDFDGCLLFLKGCRV